MKDRKTVISIFIFGAIAIISLAAGLAVFLSSNFTEENEYRHSSITNTAFTIGDEALYYFNPFNDNILTKFSFSGDVTSFSNIKSSFYRMHDSFNALAAKDDLIYYASDQILYIFNYVEDTKEILYDFSTIKTISLSQFTIHDDYLYYVYAEVGNRISYAWERIDLESKEKERLIAHSGKEFKYLSHGLTYQIYEDYAILSMNKIVKCSLNGKNSEVLTDSLNETYGALKVSSGEIRYLNKSNELVGLGTQSQVNSNDTHTIFANLNDETLRIDYLGDIVVTDLFDSSNVIRRFRLSDTLRTTKHQFDYYFAFNNALLFIDLRAGITLYYDNQLYTVFETETVYYQTYTRTFDEFLEVASASYKDFLTYPWEFYTASEKTINSYSYSSNKSGEYGMMDYSYSCAFLIDEKKTTLSFQIKAEWGMVPSEIENYVLSEKLELLNTEFSLGEIVTPGASSYQYICEGIVDGWLYSIAIKTPVKLSKASLLSLFSQFT